jgi:hypothetical protein
LIADLEADRAALHPESDRPPSMFDTVILRSVTMVAIGGEA